MRYLSSFLITSTLYIALGIGFLYAFDFTKVSKKKDENKKLSLNYVQIVKPKTEVIAKKELEKVVKKANIKPRKQIKLKETKKKKKVKRVNKKTKPKKLVKKKIVKSVKPKKTIKKEVQKIVRKEPTNTEPKTEKSFTSFVKKESKVDYKKDFLKRNLYLIKKQIQNYAKYSKRAKRMGAQGKVLIEFTLKKDGSITNIKALAGHKLLRKSTIKAIVQASKLFPRVQKNITIKVPIEYKLI